MQAQRAFLALCLSTACLSTAACTVLIAIPYGEVPMRSIPESERVVVTSEPSGATVSRDGQVVGTAPATLVLSYDTEERVYRNKYCSWIPLGGAIDLALAGAGMWASYSKLYKSDKSGPREAGPWAMVFSGLYGALGLVGVLGPTISGCPGKNPHKVAVPHDYRLRLVKDGWEEIRVVSAPVGESAVSVVIRGLEAADWRRLDSLHTIEAYREYLARYPSGSLRAQAEEVIAWLGARKQDTVIAYLGYLAEYQPGKYQREAQAAITKIFENSPDAVDEGSLVRLLASETPMFRRKALIESVRRRRTKNVTGVLLDTTAAQARRREVIDTLRDLVAENAAQRPEQAGIARTVLCDFASSKLSAELPENECKNVQVTFAPRVTQGPCDPGEGCVWRITTEAGPPPIEEQVRIWNEAKARCERDAVIRETALRGTAASAGACREDR